MEYHLGIDDTDSLRFGCTTYIAALLVERLLEMGVEFIDYPNLIRLNPNVPWKTRGNGAVCLRFRHGEDISEEVLEEAVELVEEHADFECANTNPGVVLHTGRVPRDFKMFSKRVIRSVVELREAERLIHKHGCSAVGFKNRRGLIGALAAIGETLEGDHTYELLAYRIEENWGKPRMVDPKSVEEMDRVTAPMTFDNVDPETGRVLITPRGPDPVLYGIRGETPEIVYKAHLMVKVGEEIERWVIFRTNQGTDSHLKPVKDASEVRPYNPVVLEGRVAGWPRTIPGGHVIFPLDAGGVVECAAYEPTGSFRDVVRMLAPGDVVRVYGGVRPPENGLPMTINLEKLEVLRVSEAYRLENPTCPSCGCRMKSAGRGRGFVCKRCGFHSLTVRKVRVPIERKLREGLYIPPPRAHRHLTKPLQRYGMEKSGKPDRLFNPWHWP